MRVITSARMFCDALEAERALGRRVGLVPTMGALHAGHRSLVARAALECDVVAVTVFVNPLQFDRADDLARYPRDLEGDVIQAAEAGATIVFAPPVQEMYPGFPAPVATSVHVDAVGDVLEGASRPGHFDGVATVVAKLCSLAGRARVYFGEKDFQQLAVVRRMATDLSLPVEIVPCPTVREDDGLALSSRNVRLSTAERGAAVALHRALGAGTDLIGAGERDPVLIGAAMEAVLNATDGVVADYAVAVDAATLRAPDTLSGEVRLLVAATVGPVRLIDNVGVVLDVRAHGEPTSATAVAVA
ncbi:MAG TPA: pantoate--beta-alanine ligase [Acidimicrobiales bacterium]|nr:pantoate--beta-alanine ligase [Acidimicrobiales bacterium]